MRLLDAVEESALLWWAIAAVWCGVSAALLASWSRRSVVLAAVLGAVLLPVGVGIAAALATPYALERSRSYRDLVRPKRPRAAPLGASAALRGVLSALAAAAIVVSLPMPWLVGDQAPGVTGLTWLWVAALALASAATLVAGGLLAVRYPTRSASWAMLTACVPWLGLGLEMLVAAHAVSGLTGWVLHHAAVFALDHGLPGVPDVAAVGWHPGSGAFVLVVACAAGVVAALATAAAAHARGATPRPREVTAAR